MRHATYGTDPSTASVAILVKETSFNSEEIKEHYIDPLGANPEGFIAYSLWYDDNGKCPASLAKDYLQTLLLSVKQLGIKTILVTDSTYFKYITEAKQTALSLIGHQCISKIANYASVFDVWYAPNFQAAKYNPKTEKDLVEALKSFKAHLTGSYIPPGNNIIHTSKCLYQPNKIEDALCRLLAYPQLTVDIETKGLEFWNCGIATIAFAYDRHNFISIVVDRGSYALTVKPMLKRFFEMYQGTLIGHNCGFDFKVLTYELWMDNLQDIKGMIQGIQTLTRDFEDTKLITYLATNNAVENVLKLKVLSASFMGNYAEEDIEDTTKISLPQLLEYNGKDCLATWFVYNLYYPKMKADNQEGIYKELFKPSVITLLQTELVGMPILPDKVASAKKKLTKLQDSYTKHLNDSKLVQEFQLDVQFKAVAEFTAKAKKKVFEIDDPRVQRLKFNPNSDQQVGNLLYNYLGLPVLDYTDTNQPSTAGKTLKKLLNHTTNQEYLDIINVLIGLTQVSKILTSFIPAFENAVQQPDGSWRLYGNFNLGGTVSARLSCVAPWTPIITARGEIPIYQVKIGDLVYTHKGNWKPVTDTIYKGVDYMVKVVLCTGKILTCTTEHKVLLSSGEWKTIKEILNGNFKNMDKRPSKSNSSFILVSFNQKRYDYWSYSRKARNHSSERVSCIKIDDNKSRVCCYEKGEILCVQNRYQEPNEGQVQRTAPQLDRRVFRLQRILNNIIQWRANLCSSSCNDGASRNYKITRWYGSTSHRQQSVEQRIRQSCTDYQSRTQNTTLFTGSGQPGVTIKEINYCGSTPVYDLTVKDDASYLSCGFYSHNSSKPNLQNLPSNSIYGKLIKECFGCIKGWLFGGADFNSLEDMVSALTTRDTNKMKCYLDGFDGHSLRAYSYFKDQMPDITDTVDSINSIATKYPQLRQASKAPTFLLTYQGTYHGLMNNLGLDQTSALVIEANYHELYMEADKWVNDRLQQACVDGYVTGAFGLRLRTPLLKMNGRGKLNYKAAAEGRTAGNMLGQSYGQLNSRAANEFRERVWASEYKYDILPVAQIHDALYIIWRNTTGITKWINDNLIDCMKWCGLKELQHPTVKLGAALDIFYPDWSKPTTIKNNAGIQDIYETCRNP